MNPLRGYFVDISHSLVSSSDRIEGVCHQVTVQTNSDIYAYIHHRTKYFLLDFLRGILIRRRLRQ